MNKKLLLLLLLCIPILAMDFGGGIGGGNFKSDGTVPMDGDLDLGNNSIINVENIELNNSASLISMADDTAIDAVDAAALTIQGSNKTSVGSTGDGGDIILIPGESVGGDRAAVQIKNDAGDFIKFSANVFGQNSIDFSRFFLIFRSNGAQKWAFNANGELVGLDNSNGGISIIEQVTPPSNTVANRVRMWPESDHRWRSFGDNSVEEVFSFDSLTMLLDGSNNMNADLGFTSNGQGVVLVAPDAGCWRLVVDNSGTVSSTSVTCP